MGLHYFSKCLNKSRIMLTVQNDKEIKQFLMNLFPNGLHNLKYIGIDGSIFFHAYIVQGQKDGTVDIKASAEKIRNIICAYFNTLYSLLNNNNNEHNQCHMILHFVMDGKAMYSKNRDKKKPDIFSTLSSHEKLSLEKCTITLLKQYLENYRNVFLLSTESLPFEQRHEGEIILYRFITKILNNDARYIIISNDSDITAMSILRGDRHIMFVNPPFTQTYIGLNSYNHILISLQMTPQQLFRLTILYFIFFGSDYNLGLISCWTQSKHDILKTAILQGETDLVSIFNRMRRCRSIKNEAIIWKEFGNVVTYQDYLTLFKIIVYEAVKSVLYYKSLGRMKPSSLNLYTNDLIRTLTKTIKL
ncbi:hypothetical protein TCON_2495 [Astathelohania contejeani]|uniref:Uncharacterized protein n=1 Tax=Astathelohania contejeani TaxID=164912 RepID=A0ABQ7HVX3_9MICR|nr:hypothetical protein TCON_2495 [Thelohania contejeani]